MPLQIYAGGYSLAVDVWVRPQTFATTVQIVGASSLL